jgi:hypothetical protein
VASTKVDWDDVVNKLRRDFDDQATTPEERTFYSTLIEIYEKLDPEHINSYNDLEKIIAMIMGKISRDREIMSIIR